MAYPINLPFNKKPPTLMHIDLNSCFASVEQQANPLLRGKPIAVAAYESPSGCILAPSIEAKQLGIKTGMRVKDGRMICPDLIVLPSDPWKYRVIHSKLRKLLENYTDLVTPKSIDEFVLNLEGYPAFKLGLNHVGQEIKRRIKSEIGDWLRVSIGIGPNRFLAKTAAGLKKPDGLETIDYTNYQKVYEGLGLTDLCGISSKLSARLSGAGIYTVTQMASAEIQDLKAIFNSIAGYYWYLRLRGWEIDDVEYARKSFGNSYALPKFLSLETDLAPLLMKLTEKTCLRMRRGGFVTRGVHLALLYSDGSFWHKGLSLKENIFATSDIFRSAYRLLKNCPYRKPVRNLAVSVFNLEKRGESQLVLFEDILKKKKLVTAIDKINERFGEFVITPALMIGMKEKIIDRISFGGIKDLEQFIIEK